VAAFTRSDSDRNFALHRENTEGAVHDLILATTARTRVGLLDRMTVVERFARRFAERGRNRRLEDDERAEVLRALARYRETVHPPARRRDVEFEVKDVIATGGFGIGSAGLPAYNVLLEGYDQALENDVVLSLKQGNVAASSRVVPDPRIRDHFEHHGHRTAVSQRALQAHASQFLGHTEIRVADLVDFAHDYARRTQEDHRRFVDAFRAGAIPGVTSSGSEPRPAETAGGR
jgi:uncharacterized protein (DUF2252 family)